MSSIQQSDSGGPVMARGYSLQARHIEYIRQLAQQFNPPNESAALRMIIEDHRAIVTGGNARA